MAQENFTPVGIGKFISSQNLLRYGPPTPGLFTGDGHVWAQLKKNERIREYTVPPHITAIFANVTDSVGFLFSEINTCLEEKRMQGIHDTIPGE